MKNRLCLNEKERKIFGVCSGIGDYFEVDHTLVRVIFLILFFTGTSILFYIILALVIPKEK